MKLSRSQSTTGNINKNGSEFNGAPCAYFDGMYQYFNIHYKEFKAELKAAEKLKWNGPCD